jgi:hypothetical protein
MLLIHHGLCFNLYFKKLSHNEQLAYHDDLQCRRLQPTFMSIKADKKYVMFYHADLQFLVVFDKTIMALAFSYPLIGEQYLCGGALCLYF